jgi:hypothetical protein
VSPIETTTGLPVFFLKSTMLWCISSLAVTPPPGELTSSTTARTPASSAACPRASARPSGVTVGCTPPSALSADAIAPCTGTTATFSAPSPETYSSS